MPLNREDFSSVASISKSLELDVWDHKAPWGCPSWKPRLLAQSVWWGGVAGTAVPGWTTCCGLPTSSGCMQCTLRGDSTCFLRQLQSHPFATDKVAVDQTLTPWAAPSSLLSLSLWVASVGPITMALNGAVPDPVSYPPPWRRTQLQNFYS